MNYNPQPECTCTWDGNIGTPDCNCPAHGGPPNVINVVGPDEQRPSIFGQDVQAVRTVQNALVSTMVAMANHVGPNAVGSGGLGAIVNFLLSLYTPESVQEILEGIIPNLTAMHEDIVAQYLAAHTAGSA